MGSDGLMYIVADGMKQLKSGTVSSGAKYYDESSARTLSLSKQTVFVSGAVYSGYYMDSAGKLYTVSSGTRALKSGTVASGKKYYSYNAGKYITLSKQTVYVKGLVYTGYYMDSANKMYKVKSGTRTLFTGTLAKGTSYYRYNSGKTLTLTKKTTYKSGKAQ